MRRTRWRLRKLLTLTAISAIAGGALSLANFIWTIYAHVDQHRREATKALWEKRQSAYADLLHVSARAASIPLTPDEYVTLHQEFYATSGAIEVYRTKEMGDCVTTLRDMLYACGHPETKIRETCDFDRFNRLHLRLSYDARQSLIRTWDQHPKDFLDDRRATELCPVK